MHQHLLDNLHLATSVFMLGDHAGGPYAARGEGPYA